MTTPFRDQVRDFKRERILEEASVLFYERGYRGTTLDAIAERLEVSKPFIYHHFSSKAELLVEIYKRVLRLCLDTIQAAEASPGTANRGAAKRGESAAPVVRAIPVTPAAAERSSGSTTAIV